MWPFSPLLCTGLAVGLDPQGYGNPDFCWLSLRDTLIWSFVGPVGAVIIVSGARGATGRASPMLSRAPGGRACGCSVCGICR